MPHLLARLKINEVSSVDRGAGKGVKIMLMKRDDDDTAKIWGSNAELPPGVRNSLPDEAQSVFRRVANDRMKAGHGDTSAIKQAWTAVKNGWSKQGDKWVRKIESDYTDAVAKLSDDVEAYIKREFSDEERQHLASTGAAMPGGGYPIKNGSDLENAIQAIGRAKNRAATIAHIKQRARALGMSDKIPEEWGKRDDIAGDILTIKALAEQYGAELLATTKAATVMLDIAKVASTKIIETSLSQYVAHVRELIPANKRDEFLAAIAAKQGGPDMDAREVAKAIDAAIAQAIEPISKQLEVLKAENTVLKMTPAHKEHYDKLDGDEKKKFGAMTLKERDACMKSLSKHGAYSTSGEEDDDGEQDDNAEDELKDKQKGNVCKRGKPKNGEADGEDEDGDGDSMDKRIGKAIASSPIFKQMTADLASARSVIAKMTGESEMQAFAKRAEDLGLPGHGETMRKAYGGDKDAQKAMDALLKGLAAQVDSSVLFSEFGKASDGGGSGATAYQQIRAMAAEYQKSAAGKGLSIHQCVNKVISDPANAELVSRNKAEEMRKRTGRAAA